MAGSITQEKWATTSSTDHCSVAFTSSVAAGSTLVAIGFQGTPGVGSVSDSVNGSWAAGVRFTTPGIAGRTMTVFVLEGTNNAGGTITVTGTVSGGANGCNMYIAEIAGVTSTAYAAAGGATQATQTGATDNISTGALSFSGTCLCLALSHHLGAAGAVTAAGTGWTAGGSGWPNGSNGSRGESKASATSTQTATFTNATDTTNQFSVIVALTESGGAAAPILPKRDDEPTWAWFAPPVVTAERARMLPPVPAAAPTLPLVLLRQDALRAWFDDQVIWIESGIASGQAAMPPAIGDFPPHQDRSQAIALREWWLPPPPIIIFAKRLPPPTSGAPSVIVGSAIAEPRAPRPRQLEQLPPLPALVMPPLGQAVQPTIADGRIVRARSLDMPPPLPAPPVVPLGKNVPPTIAEAPIPRWRESAISWPSSQKAPPAGVAGLVLWLEADAGLDAGLVGVGIGSLHQWDDQSGAGNNVANNGTVTWASFFWDGSSVPAVRFLGASNLVNAASSLVGGASARTILIAHKPSASPGSLLTIRTSTLKADYIPGWNFSGIGLAYTDGINNPNNATFELHNIVNAPIISTWRSAGAGTTLSYAENGQFFPVTQPSGSSTDSGTAGFTIGGGSAAVQNYSGIVAAVLVYSRALSATEELAVRTYLALKYSVSQYEQYVPRPPELPPRAAPWLLRPEPVTVPLIVAPPPLIPNVPTVSDAPRARPRARAEQGTPATPAIAVPPPLTALAGTPELPPPWRRARQDAVAPTVAPMPPRPLSVENSVLGNLLRRLAEHFREWIGLPAIVRPPDPGPFLAPPLSAAVDSVVLTTFVDSVRLTLGERLKPRKTTDTYPITNTLLSNGVAVNLTGYTVTINIVERSSRAPKRANGACTLLDAVNGRVSYQVVAGDVDTAGPYDVEWKAVSPGGTPYHFPSDGYEPLDVQPSLG